MAAPEAARQYLVGDVGSTNARFAVALDGWRSMSRPLIIEDVTSRHGELADLVRAASLQLGLDIVAASGVVLALAGRVDHGGVVCRPDTAWQLIDISEAERSLGCPMVVENDAAMTAYATLPEADVPVRVLRPGRATGDRRLCVTWGTGVGDAMVLADGARWQSFATEASSTPFAAGNEHEQELARWIWREKGVGGATYQHVLSGSRGFRRVLDWVALEQPPGPAVRAILDRVPVERQAPLIVAAALDDGDAACCRTIEIIGGAFGSYLGMRAATTLATGGVYLAGGIAADRRLMSYLCERTTMLERFERQGWLSEVVADLPVLVLDHEEPGLVGAAVRASGTW